MVRYRARVSRWRPEGTSSVCTVNVSASICLVAGTFYQFGLAFEREVSVMPGSSGRQSVAAIAAATGVVE